MHPDRWLQEEQLADALHNPAVVITLSPDRAERPLQPRPRTEEAEEADEPERKNANSSASKPGNGTHR